MEKKGFYKIIFLLIVSCVIATPIFGQMTTEEHQELKRIIEKLDSGQDLTSQEWDTINNLTYTFSGLNEEEIKELKQLNKKLLTGVITKEEMDRMGILESKQTEYKRIPQEIIEAYPYYKALKKMSDIDEKWERLPEHEKTQQAKQKYEEEWKETLKEGFGIDWDKKVKEAQPRINETYAVASLRSIHTACEVYKVDYGKYPDTLKTLLSLEIPYIDNELRNGQNQGYNFSYGLTSTGYKIIAIPIEQGVTGVKRFYIDETGVIRFTTKEEKPSANSEVSKN